MKLGFLDDGGIKSRYLQDQVERIHLQATSLYPKLLNLSFLTYGVDAKFIPILIIIIKSKINNLQNPQHLNPIPYNANYCLQRLFSHKPISSDREYFLQVKDLIESLDSLERLA